MSLRFIHLICTLLLLCFVLSLQAAKFASTSSGPRRRNPEVHEGLPYASTIESVGPYESLDIIQSKYGSSPIDPMSTAASKLKFQCPEQF